MIGPSANAGVWHTVLIDLQRRRPLALLEDRETETLSRSLRAYPSVQILCLRGSKGFSGS